MPKVKTTKPKINTHATFEEMLRIADEAYGGDGPGYYGWDYTRHRCRYQSGDGLATFIAAELHSICDLPTIPLTKQLEEGIIALQRAQRDLDDVIGAFQDKLQELSQPEQKTLDGGTPLTAIVAPKKEANHGN